MYIVCYKMQMHPWHEYLIQIWIIIVYLLIANNVLIAVEVKTVPTLKNLDLKSSKSQRRV